MESNGTRTEPPYRRIAAAIRDRIARGELAPGDRVPSARQLTREWGVALATATRALTALRHDGLVEARTGMGTVVRQVVPTPRDRPRSAAGEPALAQRRIVDTAITVADADGLDALTMRRIATELGVGVMSLYRHVAGKDALVHLMMRAVFGRDPLPDPGPPGCRAKLELACRTEWGLYRRHPWLVTVVSLTRPMLVPEAMAHTEWVLAAMDDLGLDAERLTREALALAAFVRGTALSVAAEAEAERTSGLTTDQWWQTQEHQVRQLFATGRFPRLATMSGTAAADLDAQFEYGLARYLDGLGV